MAVAGVDADFDEYQTLGADQRDVVEPRIVGDLWIVVEYSVFVSVRYVCAQRQGR